jgi:hypothetical protein
MELDRTKLQLMSLNGMVQLKNLQAMDNNSNPIHTQTDCKINHKKEIILPEVHKRYVCFLSQFLFC